MRGEEVGVEVEEASERAHGLTRLARNRQKPRSCRSKQAAQY